MSSIEQKKVERKLKKLREKVENKTCFDCTQPAPTYVCMDFGTFVCTKCSGIHREKNRVVKSVSMALFTMEEVDAIIGNGAAEQKWLKAWTPEDHKKPSPANPGQVREFMRLKYEVKRWAQAAPTQPTPQPAQPKPTQVQEVPKLEQSDTKQDLMNLFGDSKPAPASEDPFGSFFDQKPAQPQPQPQAQAQTPQNDPFDVFAKPASAAPARTIAPAPAPTPAPKPVDPLADLFGPPVTHTPAQRPQPQQYHAPPRQTDPFASEFTQPAAPAPAPAAHAHSSTLDDLFATPSPAQPVHQPAAQHNPFMQVPTQPASTNPFAGQEFTFDNSPAPAAPQARATNPFDDLSDAVNSMMFN
ncbi:Arf GTPase activating protein [Carpediemonas membranifera]|uniref:Arf GTPase activating protein n=1 Tax=Carpediemonas membranifera TaxID=201153 RepID=A0A8J6E2T5_9EUKA|nr:Arf GTPase activating protein [Carpediemonas membranifera]|eukprot:KAG9394721.1 Arf GTPase activating protein [Carpediemonas membranifera]